MASNGLPAITYFSMNRIHSSPNPEFISTDTDTKTLFEKPHQFQVFEDPEYIDSRFMFTETREL